MRLLLLAILLSTIVGCSRTQPARLASLEKGQKQLINNDQMLLFIIKNIHPEPHAYTFTDGATTWTLRWGAK